MPRASRPLRSVTVVNKSDGISAGCRLQELEQVPSAYLQALLHHAEEVEGEEDKNDEEASETSDAADDQPGEDRETDLLPLYSVANLHPCLLQAVGVANLCFFLFGRLLAFTCPCDCGMVCHGRCCIRIVSLCLCAVRTTCMILSYRMPGPLFHFLCQLDAVTVADIGISLHCCATCHNYLRKHWPMDSGLDEPLRASGGG